MTKSTSNRSDETIPSQPDELKALAEQFLTSLEERGLSAGTRSAYGRDLGRYTDHLNVARITTPDDVSHGDVEAHAEALLKRGFSSASVARSTSAIRRFHAFLITRNLCGHDPTAGLDALTVERPPPHALSVDDARLLVDAASGAGPIPLRDRAILELLYAAGLRVSELIALQVSCLDLAMRCVLVRGRGDRQRRVPIGRQAALWLDRYAREGRPHFAGADTGSIFFLSIRGRALSRMAVWKIIRAAALKAGIDPTVSPNTLRHSCARHLLEGGLDLRSLQEFLGHADQTTTEIYSRRTDSVPPSRGG